MEAEEESGGGDGRSERRREEGGGGGAKRDRDGRGRKDGQVGVFCSQGYNGPKRLNDGLFPNFLFRLGILLILSPNVNIGPKKTYILYKQVRLIIYNMNIII